MSVLVDEEHFCRTFMNDLAALPVILPFDMPPLRLPVDGQVYESAAMKTADEILVLVVKSLKTLNTLTVRVSTTETVAQWKQQLQKSLMVPSARLRLIVKGRALLDEKRISECDLRQGEIVHAVEMADLNATKNSDNAAVEKSDPKTKTPLEQLWIQFRLDIQQACPQLSVSNLDALISQLQKSYYSIMK